MSLTNKHLMFEQIYALYVAWYICVNCISFPVLFHRHITHHFDSNQGVKVVKEQIGHRGEAVLLHRRISYATKQEVLYLLARTIPTLHTEEFDDSNKMAHKYRKSNSARKEVQDITQIKI